MTDKSTHDQIVEAADRLFYRQGYEHTSFADIAAAVRISRGNFYHHFKSKDEILQAVIQLRIRKTQQMLERWEAEGEDPVQRIQCFVRILIANQTHIERHGCPVGTLCTELMKLNHVAHPEAARLFTLFRTWLGRQFTRLGRRADADALAMHVLAWSQGVAVLANTFQDDAFIRREVEQTCAWVTEIADSARPASPNVRRGATDGARRKPNEIS